MKILNPFRHLFTLLLAMGLFACAPPEEEVQEAPEAQLSAAGGVEPVTHAISVLHPTEGNDVLGVVHFYDTPEGVRVVAEVQGLTPGEHGFHVHEFGDCSAPDATSAGGHFNPDNTPHGAPTDATRHVGDLGNLSADDAGAAQFQWTDSLLAFHGPHSILGRGVIVHAGEDDYTSQPSGAAGPRVACGVIGIAMPEGDR
jgi:Cu-Zn family superoxide dismutase